jgi:hypothetical protein
MLQRLAISAVLSACAAFCGCASYSAACAPQYAAAWEQFAESSTELMKMKKARAALPQKRMPKHEEYEKRYREQEENREFAQRFEETVKKEAIAARTIDELQQELKENREFNRSVGVRDPGYEAWLGERYEQLRERLNAKAMEILRIEPTVSIAEGTKLKVAIVEIGDGIRTIRYPERRRWREFFREAGFAVEPVFLPAFIVGDYVSADAIRRAASRVGAGAVLAYTTATETDLGPLRESAAVLAFAKCLLVDTRTEYLYFNAEGEGRRKKIGLPLMVDVEKLQRSVTKLSIEGLRSEILHELQRLRSER